MPDQIALENGAIIPGWELTEQFIRASGPGGQGVNTTSSAVQLRWSVADSSLSAGMKAKLGQRLRGRLTKTGELVLEASEHRSQARNREAARQRLKGVVDQALRPRKKRKATRPTRGSVRRRLKAKKERGEIKALRGKVDVPRD